MGVLGWRVGVGGCYLDDHLTLKETVDVLASSASRALAYIPFKLKCLKECRCSVFTQLYSTCVCPIMHQEYSPLKHGKI